MATFIPNSKTILSMFPVALETFRVQNGFITYRHPEADKSAILVRTFNPERMMATGPIQADAPVFTDERTTCEAGKGYTLIRVYDTFVWTRDFTQDNERFIPHPIPAELVATDLVTAWAGQSLKGDGGSGPGIMMIVGDEPTADELAAVRQKQSSYFRTLINDGTTLHSKGQVKDISDLHRAAAGWMGARNLPWVAKIEEVEMKKCVACGNDIRKVALRCEHCSADLVDFYRKFQIEIDVNADPVVAALIARLSAPKSKVA